MMDPATARLAIKIQIQDVDAILMTLPKSSNEATALGERAAFEALRSELARKWNELHGQAYAHHILHEENANRTAFKRLLSEEQQAERDHDMACRLAGKPVPQRSAVSNKRPADGEAADKRAEAVNGTAAGNKKLRVHFDGTHTAGPKSEPTAAKKRPADHNLAWTLEHDPITDNTQASKQARVGDADKEPAIPQARSAASNMRVAFLDPAILREDQDGRTKRARLEEPFAWPRLDLDRFFTTSPAAIGQGTCSSCLDMHPKCDMLQLSCKDDGDTDAHAYCRDCLRRLFESSVADPSHFPPRCCSKLISLFSCTPFLPQELIARFVARREELETPNRTYCSNTKCSKWVKPASIIGGVATCTFCAHGTCVTCKNKQHEGLCPEDKDVKELMSVAHQKRWQTCPHCKEMVELERGCYHITCRCRHEFCYLCVAKWKTCKCASWDERNIIDGAPRANNAAQPVIDAAAPNVPAPFAPVVAPAPPLQPAFPVIPYPAPAQAPAPPPAPVPQGNLAQFRNNAHGRRRGNRHNGNRNRFHVHNFERYYRSEDWNTECHRCGHEDRWVNCCVECGLAVCWYCTKHHV